MLSLSLKLEVELELGRVWNFAKSESAGCTGCALGTEPGHAGAVTLITSVPTRSASVTITSWPAHAETVETLVIS